MKTLTEKQVLARMRSGDLPTRSGGGGYVIFNDGKKAGMTTMLRLVRIGTVNPPEHTSLFSPYTLA